MQQVFLIIITALGAIYALATKQLKIALGFLVLAISFVFTITNLVTGIWVDVFGAISMIIFALGIFLIVFKRTKKEVENTDQENTNQNEK